MAKRNVKSPKSKNAKPTPAPTPRPSSSSSSSGSGSRSRTRDRRQERLQQKRRQQQITFLIAIVSLVVIAGILFIVVNQPASAPIPEGVFDRYQGIPQTTTDAGFARLGSPDAPVSVEEYSSFSCPACATFHQANADYILEQVRAGVISFTYIPLTLGSIPNAAGAARAAICAGEQNAFYEMHDALFDWHLNFGNQAFTQNRLSTGIENLNLNEGNYNSCIGSSRPDTVLSAATNSASARGIGATPTLVVNGNILQSTAELPNAVASAFASSGLPAVPLAPPPVDPIEGEVATEEVTEELEDIIEEATAEAEEMTTETEETTDEATTEDDSAEEDMNPEETPVVTDEPE